MKNTFGQAVTLTLFGESHGAAVGAVLDGLAPGLPVDGDFLRRQLSRRRPTTALDTARQEPDNYQILSGVFQGRTTGTPLTIVIPNENTRSGDYTYGLARPSHADYAAYCAAEQRITLLTPSTTAIRMPGAADTSPDALPRRWWRRAPSCCPPLPVWASPWAHTSFAAAARGIAPLPTVRRRTWPPCRGRISPP